MDTSSIPLCPVLVSRHFSEYDVTLCNNKKKDGIKKYDKKHRKRMRFYLNIQPNIKNVLTNYLAYETSSQNLLKKIVTNIEFSARFKLQPK